jgi:hypothetical protein
MAVDEFTAMIGVQALARASNSGSEQEWNDTYDLVKAINEDGEGISDNDKVYVEQRIGERCVLINGDRGVVTGVNEATSGLYHGSRYPFIVKRDDGQIFEYDLRSVKFRSKSITDGLLQGEAVLALEDKKTWDKLVHKYPGLTSSKEMSDKALKEDDIDLLELSYIYKKLEKNMMLDTSVQK